MRWNIGIIWCTLLLIFGCAPQPKIQKLPEEKKPTVSEAKKYHSSGFEYFKNGQYEDAIRNYKQAIAESTLFVDAYLDLARTYTVIHNYEEAESTYMRLINILPNEPNGYYGLGRLYTEERKYVLALQQYDKALEIDPEDALAFYGKGYVNE